MTQEDFRNQMVALEDEVPVKNVKKGSRWKWIAGAVAACLVLMMVLPFVSPRYHMVADKPLYWKPIVYKDMTFVDGSRDLNSGFKHGIVLQVKLTKVFRDAYYDYTDSDSYRIAEFKVLDKIVGYNVPNVIYVRLSDVDYKDWNDLKEYDSLIVVVGQLAIEGAYPMVNLNTNKVERFGALFNMDTYAVAIKNGALDESFSHICETSSCRSGHSDALFVAGRSIADCKKAIQDLAATKEDTLGVRTVITPYNLPSNEVRQAYEYIMSTNGDSYFAPYYYYRNSYARYVDGYVTDEVVCFDMANGTVEYLGLKYTDEMLESLISVEDVINKLNPSKMTIPGAAPVEKGITRVFEEHYARYYVEDGQIYSTITLIWRDYEEGKTKSIRTIRAEAHVMPDGNIEVVEYKSPFAS